MVNIWLVLSYLYFLIFLMHCFCSKKLTEVVFSKNEKEDSKDTKTKYSLKGANLMVGSIW